MDVLLGGRLNFVAAVLLIFGSVKCCSVCLTVSLLVVLRASLVVRVAVRVRLLICITICIIHRFLRKRASLEIKSFPGHRR